MDNEKFNFRNAVFTYLISDKISPDYAQHTYIFNDSLVINHSLHTDVMISRKQMSEAVIIGFCVDSHGELDRQEIADFMAEQNFLNSEDAFYFSRRFAGRFVILYRNRNFFTAWSDACGLLQINYAKINGHIILSSLDELIGREFGLSYSAKAVSIKNMADYTQTLPYQITLYDDVKFLPPNHVLDLKSIQMLRVPLKIQPLKKEEQSNIIRNCCHQLIQITEEYGKYYKIRCPVTAGMDSRVVLALLKNRDKNQVCYTFYHSGFTSETDDIKIPAMICENLKLPYEQLKDLIPDQEYIQNASLFLGKYFSTETLALAFTFRCSYENDILIHSDILDQIGKSSLGKNIPSFLAVPSYMTCKIHNFSKYIQPEMKKMVRDFKNNGEHQNGFDLFCMEQDIARWCAQAVGIYAVCGVTALNLFNCGEVIDTWLSIPRSLRVKYWIHKELLKILDPDLLNYPSNPHEKYRCLKKNSLIMWTGSYLRYWKDKMLWKF